MRFLYMAHSGLRYLVLLVALAAVVTLAMAIFGRRQIGATRGLTAAYTGLLHVQLLIGIALVVMGIWYPALIGHLAMMVVAVAVATVLPARAKRATDPIRADKLRLYGVGISLVLIVLGITAIGRGLFESRAMTGG